VTRLVSLLFHDVYADDPSESGFAGAAADRYKLPLAAFERQLDGLARARRDAPLLVDDRTVAVGRTAFAITIDDGGVSLYTQVADRLERLGWRAHCFITTGRIGERGFLAPSQLRELRARGHVLGSHSASHPTRFGALSPREMVKEWGESRAALQDLLGQDVTVGSVPGGYYTPRVAAAAAEAGLRVLFTSEPETRRLRGPGRRAGAFDIAPRVGGLEREESGQAPAGRGLSAPGLRHGGGRPMKPWGGTPRRRAA